MKKILLDTDIGSDIDDAVALAYLLANPDCKLLGVTTVSGDVQKRAALVEMILSRSGQSDVPIHCGRREPLLMGPGQPHVPHYEFVKHHPHRLDRPENTAVDFLRQTIRAHPNELTLLSIGPMGNLATLFTVDPEIPFLLAGCVSMAGQFFEGARREWNVIVDPAAAATVARTPRPDHKWVGLDVTLKCKMNAQEVHKLQVSRLEACVGDGRVLVQPFVRAHFSRSVGSGSGLSSQTCIMEKRQSWGRRS